MSGLEELRRLCNGSLGCTAPEHWEGCYAEAAYAAKHAELRAETDKLLAERDTLRGTGNRATGLEELRRLEGAATKGPWVARQDFIDGGVPDNSMTINGSDGRGDYIASVALSYKTQGNDAEFIVAARNQLPRILDALDAVTNLHECDPDFGKCTDCDDEWPCRTVAAITTALQEGERL